MIERAGAGRRASDLASLRRISSPTAARRRATGDGSFEFFSAPGEGRECVEIARRILREAARGVAFDEMAVLVRAPRRTTRGCSSMRSSAPACRRGSTAAPGGRMPAGAPFWRCWRAPPKDCPRTGSPSTCRSASCRRPMPGARVGAAGRRGVRRRLALRTRRRPAEPESPLELASEDQPAIAGTLRTPRRWERMLVEAAVIGGDPERWRRRLDGFGAELRIRLEESRRADPESSLTQAPRTRSGAAGAPRRPSRCRWFARWRRGRRARHGASGSSGSSSSRRACCARPATCCACWRTCGRWRPWARSRSREVRAVLASGCGWSKAEPPARRYGRVFVGSPAQARGRTFRVVFVPGLAERVFPQKSRQDPLLPDAMRARLERSARDQSGSERPRAPAAAPRGRRGDRAAVPVVPAARRRGVAGARAVVLRARRGARRHRPIPDHEELAAAAARAGNATLAWPAPPDAGDGDRRQEHDLAVLRGLLDARTRRSGARPRPVPAAAQRGAAAVGHRALGADRARSGRSTTAWCGSPTHPRGAGDPAARRRPYSVSALQRFAACPVPVPAGRHPPAAGRRAAGAAAAPRSADQGQHRPPDPGGRPCARCATSGAAADGRVAARGAGGPGASIAQVADEYRERMVPGHRARLAGGDRGDRARPARLAAPRRRRRGVGAALLRAGVRPAARSRTRSAQRARAGARRRPLPAAWRHRRDRGAPRRPACCA